MHHKTFLFSALEDGSRNVVMQASHNLTTTQLSLHNNAVIVRDWYNILNYRVADDGRCRECGGAIAGRFQHFDKAFGSRRIPVRMTAASG